MSESKDFFTKNLDPSIPEPYLPLPHHLLIHAAKRPQHLALITPDEIIDYATLVKKMRQGAYALKKIGIRQGSRVQVVSHNKIDLILATLSAMAAGASVLPVSAAEEDLHGATQYFKPHLVVLDRNNFRSEDFTDKVPASCITDLCTGQGCDPVPLDPEDIGLLILTSGTTRGVRRGTLLSHRSLSGSASYMNARMGLDHSVRDLVSAPLEHGFGMGRVRCALHIGGTAVLQSGLFAPRVIAEELFDLDCNMLSAAVSAMSLLIEQALPQLTKSSSNLKWIELGTGHLPNQQRELLLERFPNTRCFVSYGLTEAIRCTFLELNTEQDKLASVGRPSPGIQIRLVDEYGNVVSQGEEGSIEVNGVNVASGYLEQPEAWKEKLNGDWLTTGDRGLFDQDGYLYYVGRTDDMINVGGLKVAPQEVEEALSDFLSGSTYAVARISDPTGIEGYVPALFIEGDSLENIEIEDVRNYLRDRLPNFKLPRILYRPKILPRTSATRKIRRAALAEIAKQIELEALPKTTQILKALDSVHRHWPALINRKLLKRSQVASVLKNRTQCNELLELVPFLNSNDVEWIGKDILHWQACLSLQHGDVVSLPTDGLEPDQLAALLLHAWEQIACVAFYQSGSSSLASELGRHYQIGARYVFIYENQLQHWSSAPKLLADAWQYPEFEAIILVDEASNLDALAVFEQRFKCLPKQLIRNEKEWHLREIPSTAVLDLQEQTNTWPRLRQLAAEIFKLPIDRLSKDSHPDDTPGWDSLAFVSLIVELEKQWQLRLKARDIVSVANLGDLLRIVENQTKSIRK
ncbi:MAG: AMP-binding protein [Sedimenticola sp.]